MRNDYVPNFKVPGPKRPSGNMWLTVLLCVVLPPVGLVLLWSRARCPLRGKLLLSLISALVMVALLTWYLGRQEALHSVVPEVPVTVTYGAAATPEPTPVSASPQQPADAPQQTLPEGVIPANPVDSPR